jgi:hypothetical protein
MVLTALDTLQQHAGGALEPDESYLAGGRGADPPTKHPTRYPPLRPPDPDNGRPMRDPMLGAVAMVVMTARDEQLMEPVAAISLPSTGGILGVTDLRVIVFGLGFRLGPTDLLGAVERTGVQLESEPFRASLVHRERIRVFSDGELFVDGSVRASNPDLPTLRSLIPPVTASPD